MRWVPVQRLPAARNREKCGNSRVLRLERGRALTRTGSTRIVGPAPVPRRRGLAVRRAVHRWATSAALRRGALAIAARQRTAASRAPAVQFRNVAAAAGVDLRPPAFAHRRTSTTRRASRAASRSSTTTATAGPISSSPTAPRCRRSPRRGRRSRQPPLSQRRRHEVHRRHRRGRRQRRRLRHGRGGRRLRQRRPRRPLRGRRRAQPAAAQPRRRQLRGRDRRAPRIASGEWAAAAGWFDYDNDGRLDLLVVNYVRWSAEGNRFCGDQARGLRIYCHPRYFEGLPNRLYRNRGDGTFEDVSAASGIARHVGKGMSVAFADYDHDGDVDAFVTNDTVPNFLFRNNGDGTFSETALAAGVAVPGVGPADLRHGRRLPGLRQRRLGGHPPDRHLRRDLPALPQRLRHAARHVRRRHRLERHSPGCRPGCRDGARCSSTSTTTAPRTSSPPTPIRTTASSAPKPSAGSRPNSLFLNDGSGRFRDATRRIRPRRRRRGPSRLRRRATSTATAASTSSCWCSADGAELWQNETGNGNAWLTVRLVGTRSNRDGIGARVIVGDQVRTMTHGRGLRVVFARRRAFRAGRRPQDR